MPGLAPLIRRTGMWPATYPDLLRLLGERELVLYFPEGVAGIGKGWKRRYQTQPFHTSFIRACVRYRAPVLPCACVGAEAMNPFATNLPRVARASGLPIFPLSPLQLALFPTWLSSVFFALPTQLRYFIGAPLTVRLDEATATDADYRAAAEELRVIIQGMIDAHRDDPAEPVHEPVPPASARRVRVPLGPVGPRPVGAADGLADALPAVLERLPGGGAGPRRGPRLRSPRARSPRRGGAAGAVGLDADAGPPPARAGPRRSIRTLSRRTSVRLMGRGAPAAP